MEVKKKANFKCCMCQGLIVDVHHIVPSSEGGLDTMDNAAPLCAGCHRTYGGNPDHRKTIRDMRDHWFEICEQQNKAMPPGTKTLFEKVDGMHGDIKEIKTTLINFFEGTLGELKKADSLEAITAVASTVSSGTNANVFVTCLKCNRPMTHFGNHDYRCENCDTPQPPNKFIRHM